MVMDGERTEIWEEEMEVGTSSSGSEDGSGSGRGGVLIRDLVGIIESVAQLEDFRRTQRKECLALVRRLKLLLPVLEELRDTPPLLSLPRKPLHALFLLKKALLLATKLLTTCNAGSKIYLALESEGFMIKFHVVNDKIHQALNNIMSCHEFGMSDEVKEHVELLQTQLTRAKRRTDTQDIEFAVDMMVVCSKTDERNADSAIIERLAKKLELHTEEDVKTETLAVKHLVEQKGGVETLHQVVELLNKFKRILGMEETDLLLVANPAGPPKMLDKPSSLVIPNEFLCPITQEIMMDPVIVATGQSYERESIQKWFDSNHRTCPKTRQTLSDLSLAPNYALKTLILQWCEKHDLKVPRKEAAEESSTSDEEIHSLIKHLCSSQLDVQRRAAKGIRLLSKENPTNRVLFARYGAIPVLVQVLPYPDTKIQEHAVTALLNLSIDESNKKLIADAGAVPAIIEVLKNGSVEARENSAAALFSLSMLDENKVAVGSWNGIPPLVELLRNGTIRGKRDAASALFNLSLNHHNKGKAIEAGIAVPLTRLVEDRKLGMVDEALSIFLLLATHVEGRQAIGQLSFIQVLVDLIREGTAKNRECAVSVLLELGSNNSAHILAALQFGVYEHLVEVSTSGTNRGQRKANALLQLITKSEQI